MRKKLKAVVLAAGKGTRLHSDDNDAPKVMREANGKPMLWYVLDAISFIEKEDIIIVIGYKKDHITSKFTGYTYANQDKQLGTGHAVMSAVEQLKEHSGALLLCYGDMPAIKRETYEQLIHTHFEQRNDCTLLTSQSDIPMPYGRVKRDENGAFIGIIEEKECTPEELKITELNTGVYVFDTTLLLSALGELKNDNVQGEYYITDVPAIMKENGAKINILKQNLGDDIIGVNTREQLEMVEQVLGRDNK